MAVAFRTGRTLMGVSSSRLFHAVKVSAGKYLKQFLQALRFQGVGSASRLVKAFSTSLDSGTCDRQILVKPDSYETTKPAFFVADPSTEAYLKRYAKHECKETRSAGIISAEDVDVSFPTGMHQWHGKLIEEAVLDVNLLDNPKYVLGLETIASKRKKVFSEEAVLLSMPWHHNFYHWTIEIMPRLSLYDASRHVRGLPLIVPQSCPRFVRESLELFGYADRVRFLEDGAHRFKKLHIPSKLSNLFEVSPKAIDWLNHKAIERNIGAAKAKRIYVSRADASIRYVANEAEVRELLSDRYGFETVVMSQHTLQQQIEIFRGADIVIGSHGAAFAHAAFMPPGGTLIELFQESHFAHPYYCIATLRNLKYGFLVCRKSGCGLSVDTQNLSALMEQILA